MKNFIHDYYSKYRLVRSPDFDVNIPLFLLKSAYYHLLQKNLFAHHDTRIVGLGNIETGGKLFVGVSGFGGPIRKYERTVLNIQGKLVIDGDVIIGRACYVAIGKGAVCTMRKCRINSQTNFIIGHGLEIGKGSWIAWGCEIMDEDFHNLEYEGKIQKNHTIVIGEHVWIGSHVTILKGVHIGDNSVIASNSVVTRSFEENSVLIGGHPAQVIRRGIKWS
jgi:UDP-3-O-[3-hydroxymyristoyl] glucosamine N-acyltransferase